MEWLTTFPQLDPAVLLTAKRAIDGSLRSLTRAYGQAIEDFFYPLQQTLIFCEKVIAGAPWPLVILALAAVAWAAARSWGIVAAVVGTLCAIGLLGLWEDAMLTVSLVLTSTIFAILIGLPLGIVMNRYRAAGRIMQTVLDVMQTMPPFVYLIPVVMLLGIGRVPGFIAVVIYALPPIIRLTDLGIRLVDKEVLEAADAYGCSRNQKLWKVQLPLAMPTIMAGINQTIMMALGMVVIASMIGVQGLGLNVLQAIANQYFTQGIFNGFAIVGIAIVFDRISQAYGRRLQSTAEPGMTDARSIEIRDLYKIFGNAPERHVGAVKAGMTKAELGRQHGHILGLNNINITMPGGKIHVIMGLSGSGKSTLIRHINRLIEPTAGQVLIDGRDILHMSEEELREFRRSQTAMVFQKFALLPHRSVLDNVTFGLEVRGIAPATARDTGMRWLERVGLTGFEARYPDELSGGMQQRVGLARALSNDAPILLMDEAYSALDPLIRTDMQTMLLDLQAELKKTVVFITHDLDEALRLGDQIVILRDGQVVQRGDSQTILMAPADDYIRRFVKDVNRGRFLRVDAVMQPGQGAGPAISTGTTLEAAAAMLTRSASDCAVITGADGAPLGQVTLRQITAALSSAA